MARGGKASAKTLLVRQLKLQVWPEEQSRDRGFVYRGPADFLLQHGEWFEPQPLPDLYRRGLPKHCYGNSINMAVLHDLEYVEGWALDPGASALAFHHAWNCQPGELAVIDTTWTGTAGLACMPGGRIIPIVGLAGSAYLGVRFSVERADDCTWNGDASVLDDDDRRWPLLRQRWEGEPTGLVWPPTSRLEALRARRRGDETAVRRFMDAAEAELSEGSIRGA